MKGGGGESKREKNLKNDLSGKRLGKREGLKRFISKHWYGNMGIVSKGDRHTKEAGREARTMREGGRVAATGAKGERERARKWRRDEEPLGMNSSGQEKRDGAGRRGKRMDKVEGGKGKG